MLILIAESKTMTTCDCQITAESFSSHTPCFNDKSNRIMCDLSGLSIDILAQEVKISIAMARSLHKMAYDFPFKTTGEVAIKAYTGVVFKAFSFNTLPKDEKQRAGKTINIISSLYGLLEPFDIIKPYRLDYTTRLAPGNLSFCSYWKTDVTSALIEKLKINNETEILDLLPADAAKCIDWKEVSKHAKVMKADFRTVMNGGKTKTPTSNRLKTLRGLLLRQIMTDGIDLFDSLSSLSSSDYFAEESTENSIIFTTAH